MIKFGGLVGIAERVIAYFEALSSHLGLWNTIINFSIVFWLRFKLGITWKLELILLAPACLLDEIPEYLVKRCAHYMKKPLVHIFSASLKSEFFPDKMKIAKDCCIKKGKDRKFVITGQY